MCETFSPQNFFRYKQLILWHSYLADYPVGTILLKSVFKFSRIRSSKPVPILDGLMETFALLGPPGQNNRYSSTPLLLVILVVYCATYVMWLSLMKPTSAKNPQLNTEGTHVPMFPRTQQVSNRSNRGKQINAYCAVFMQHYLYLILMVPKWNLPGCWA